MEVGEQFNLPDDIFPEERVEFFNNTHKLVQFHIGRRGGKHFAFSGNQPFFIHIVCRYTLTDPPISLSASRTECSQPYQPSVGSVTAVALSSTSIKITVSGSNASVYRGNTYIGSCGNGGSVTDSGLSPGTTYSYTAKASGSTNYDSVYLSWNKDPSWGATSVL